jgi:hypothetical protein
MVIYKSIYFHSVFKEFQELSTWKCCEDHTTPLVPLTNYCITQHS